MYDSSCCHKPFIWLLPLLLSRLETRDIVVVVDGPHLSCQTSCVDLSWWRCQGQVWVLHKRNSSYLLPNIIFLVGHDFNIRSHGRGERCKRKLADFPSVNGDCKIPLRRDLAWLGEDSASDGDSTAGLDNKIVSCEQLAHSAQPSIIMP